MSLQSISPNLQSWAPPFCLCLKGMPCPLVPCCHHHHSRSFLHNAASFLDPNFFPGLSVAPHSSQAASSGLPHGHTLFPACLLTFWDSLWPSGQRLQTPMPSRARRESSPCPWQRKVHIPTDVCSSPVLLESSNARIMINSF